MNNIINHTNDLLVLVFGLVVAVTGVGLAARAKKAQYSDVARVSVVTFVSMAFIAIGLGAVGFAAFGGKILAALGIG